MTTPQVKEKINLEWVVSLPSGKTLTLYSKEDADDFTAMIIAAQANALEIAARVLDEQYQFDSSKMDRKLERCADAIRALKGKLLQP